MKRKIISAQKSRLLFLPNIKNTNYSFGLSKISKYFRTVIKRNFFCNFLNTDTVLVNKDYRHKNDYRYKIFHSGGSGENTSIG